MSDNYIRLKHVHKNSTCMPPISVFTSLLLHKGRLLPLTGKKHCTGKLQPYKTCIYFKHKSIGIHTYGYINTYWLSPNIQDMCNIVI